MKWKYLLFLVLLSLSLFSCSLLKKTKTITETVTVTKIDTIVKVKFDTVKITSYGYLTDTVVVENKTSVARSYFNPVKNKIVVELKGKIFNVPVTIDQVTTTTQTKKERERKFDFFKTLGLTAIILIILFILYLGYKLIKLR